MADLKRFFKKTVSEDRHKQAASVSVPEGLWIKCPKCGLFMQKLEIDLGKAYGSNVQSAEKWFTEKT